MNRRNFVAMRWWASTGSIVGWLCLAAAASAQMPFFPGAEGYGGTWSGTAPSAGWLSNASVYHVTNLNDDGPGSLRNAFQENSSNKIVVFDVAGTISIGDKLDIKNVANYYIAGQTAPGPVTITGNMSQLTHSSDKENRNVVLRYMSFRKGTSGESDAITFAGGGLGTNLMLDHISASWSEDEILSVANNNTNVTVQYSMINDALVNGHAYGSLIRPRISSDVTFHHNLYAHNASRQARFGTYNGELLTADFRNNVIYNWRDRASYSGGSSENDREFADINYVGNYLVAGPGTEANHNTAFVVDKNIDTRVYQAGNEINGNDTGWGMFHVQTGGDKDGVLVQMPTPFDMPPVATQSAGDAYQQVIDHVGNFWWDRDAIDSRVVNNVLDGTGPPIGMSAPDSAELNGLLSAPMVSHASDWDTDGDGMPDWWEEKHGLDATSAGDWNQDFDNDGYVNLIEYINEAGEVPAPAPILFSGEIDNRYAHILNWRTDDGDGASNGSHWQPSRYDEAQINDGTVVVDAIGQRARLLKIGANPGDNAMLNITNGWLEVQDEVLIGADPGAASALHLSGGALRTAELNRGPEGTFSFTGGTLHAEAVNFDLEIEGGTLAPGSSVGHTHIAGDLTLTSGALKIELLSPTTSDTLSIEGQASLGGDLMVALLEDFAPESGSWEILTAESIVGNFDSVTEGYSVQTQGNSLMLTVGDVPVLAGDYNGDGIVDAADYTVWRDQLGQSTSLPNETESMGIVDHADYAAWKSNFGAVHAEGTAATGGGAVPEPTGVALLWIGWGMGLVARRGWQRPV